MAKAPKKVTVDPNETKAEKFTRLAPKRVTKALKAIRGIENLASANYESTDAQKTQIIDALQTAIDSVGSSFWPEKNTGSSDEFSFEDENEAVDEYEENE